MKKSTKLLALFLAVVMLVSAMPMQALAYMVEKSNQISIVGNDGKVITPDESWETTFPYGTFAFEQSDISVAEGGDGVIRVYRLGGTIGRATAFLTYVPTIAEMADGSKAYANAAGNKDILISAENPLPIAQYQPLGKLPEPFAPEKPVSILQNTYAGADAQAGDLQLTLDTKADTYQWQTLYAGSWKPVDGATMSDFVVAASDFAEYDFRCIYTVGEKQYGSNSAKGTVYVREEEVLPPQPADIELNPKPTYTAINADSDKPYLGYAFEVTFAENEWVKEIKLVSPEDTLPETDKFGTFTIMDCLGGSLYGSANTLALRVTDNEAPEPCSLGFAVTAVEADKASGDAIVTVRRTGGNQAMLTIDYSTKDGTALAGEDYMSTSGTLTFYADADEQQIKIPLINDKTATEERRDFSVVLSNLKGDKDKICTLTETTATVSLWNSGKEGAENLATLLKDGGAEDISGAVVEGTSSVAPTDAEPVTGTQVVNNSEPLTGVIGKAKKGDAGLLTYEYGNPIFFARFPSDRPEMDQYWRDYYCFARVGGDYSTYDMNSIGPMPFFEWEAGVAAYPGGSGRSAQFFSVNKDEKTLGVSDTLFAEHYDSIETLNEYSAEWLDHMLFGYEFTYGGTALMGTRGSDTGVPTYLVREDCGAHMEQSGPTSNKLVFKNRGFLRASWTMQDRIDSLTLETKWFDKNASSNPAKAALRSGILHRRSLTNDLRLRILTANDDDTHGTAAKLDGDFYEKIKPEVTIVPEMGGVTTAGKLYVGSTLNINLSKSGGAYTPGNGLGAAVFLTDSRGNVIANATGSGPDYKLTIEANNIPLNDNYTINVVMNRKQNLNLDIRPSVPRLKDKVDIDTSKTGEAWDSFWKSNGGNGITCGITEKKKDGTRYGEIQTVTYKKENLTGYDASKGLNSIQGIENLQWVNFNCSEEDRILYNGRVYKGNEKIFLQQSDLSLQDTNFLYYQKDYISAKSIMTPTLQRTGLYLDKNCNGQIDGYWDRSTNFFVLDKDAKTQQELDEFFYDLQRNVDYDESMFAPVAMEWDKITGKPTKYAQYFIKSVYQMTPRALVAPPDAKPESERAQVLPAFVSNVTDTGAYSRLTDQQKAYRYLISGQNRVGDKGTYARSADNHIMYGGEANLVSCIDIPLGGDTKPVTLKEDKVTFVWEPNYQGNLLYPFADPDPIFIAHSLAGDNIPVAEVAGYPDGKPEYKDSDGTQKVNGYLGSFTSNDTFALCVREQTQTTDEIAKEKGVTPSTDTSGGNLALLGTVVTPPTIEIKGHPKPECVVIGSSGTFPNSSYLKETKPGGDMPNGGMDMEAADSDYPEFNQDMGMEFPAGDVAATDLLTVIMDGYEVGFAIGIPLGGYNSNGDAGTGGVGTGGSSGKDNGVSPKKAFKSFGEDMGKLKDICKSKSKKAFGDSLKDTDDSFAAATAKGSDKKLSAHAFTVEVTVSLAFIFKYNPVDNGYYFSQFTVMPAADLGFKYQYRFSGCPIFYLYVVASFHVELGSGVTSERKVVERANPVLDTQRVGSYKQVQFKTDRRAFNITFNGKMLVECFTDSTCKTPLKNSAKGMVSSDGEDAVTLTITKGSSVMNIPDCYVRLTALTEVDLDNVTIVDKMETVSYCNGFNLAPEVFVEAGLGAGIEICKIEIFVKLNIGCSMTMGAYNEKTEIYDPFVLNDFSFGLGLGFRVVFLVFSYEMDLIRYDLNYDKDRDPEHKPGEPTGWVQSWAALGGLYGGESGISATDSQGNTYGVRVRLPGDTSQSQTIYSGEKPSGDVDPLAYDPNDEKVPFQLSGYGSSGDAFKLADGLITGYDYKVIAADGNNYLIYTISRTGAAHAVDNTMLVLSKIKLTADKGVDSYGLVNPLDETNTTTPYILLDTTDGTTDDGTGDLEFKAWTDTTGVIHASWVSYATKAKITGSVGKEPDATVPKPVLPNGTAMDEVNYENPGFKPTEPTPVVTEPTPVVPGNYFLSKTDYEASTDADKATKYTVATDNAEFYVATTYITKEAADAALAADTVTYNTANAAYATYVLEKAEYDTALANYNAWVLYFTGVRDLNAEIQAIAAEAAKNTVVKTASFNPKQTENGFTPAKVVSGGTVATPTKGSHVFLPIPADDKVTVYAKAKHYASTTDLEAGHKAYLKNIGYDPTSTVDSNAKNMGAYRLAYQKGLWDAYGEGSSLCVSVDGTVTELELTAGQTLVNIEAAKIGTTYYVAYTTSELQYMDKNETVVEAAKATDLLTISRLFLRTFTVDGTGNKALLLRTLYDYEVATGKDGLYKGKEVTTYDDPYFANLQFLSAKLGNELKGENEIFDTMADPNPQLESFLLFEMNGSVYVIREASLESITGSTKTGQIIPFFTPAFLPSAGSPEGKKQQTTTGRAEVTIGADGAGNLSAVYVGTVPNTTNNALYLTKYDPTSSKWGVGTMLAMNYMQVHEDSVARGMYGSDTEKAFLGKLAGYTEGGMDQFKFSNLQIALGQTKTADAGGLSLSADANGVVTVPGPPPLDTSLLTAPPDTGLSAAGSGTKDTLLVITQGSMTYLEERTVKVGDKPAEIMIAPLSDAAAKALYEKNKDTSPYYASRVPGLGVYAVSYGAGGQAIGESHLSFADYNFSSGEELKAGLSFFNTGDVAIRASKDNKATVQLMLKTASGSTPIATWELTENVLAGQKVILSGICDPLTTDLPEGSIFYIEVSEDKDYFHENAFTANTLKTITNEDGSTTEVGNLTVGSKAELGFARMGTSIKPVAMDESGNTVLDVQFKAENRGNKQAKGVFVQFSYDNGTKDTDGNPVYVPLDITNNTLKVSVQEELEPLAITKNDLPNGIFYLKGTDGDDIKANFGRTVTGTITVPSALYLGSLTGSLNINVEIFSADDSTETWTAGLVTVKHAEYDSNNNRFAAQVEHNSFFQSAAKVAIPMGTTMRLPLQVSTTKNTAPNIAVDEVPANGEETHLGVRYYQPGTFAKGKESGTLILAPSSLGSGVLHLKDVNTNALYAVAYTVTEATEGINIFNDTDMFTFKNADGGKYDPTAVGVTDWRFEKGVPTWGEPVKGETNPAPYLSDLAKGKLNTSFTYRTQAESMKLYFNGEVKVTSDLPGFTAQTVSATGGKSFAEVSFSTNTKNVPHDVTITVTKAPGGYADFDRIVEDFGPGNPPPTPSDDKNAPHLFWSRSFPDTATLASGSVPLTCYILDDGSLASVTVNGKEPDGITKTPENFWKFSLDVAANGPLSVAATDTAGNRTTRTTMVDWFNTPASSTGSSAAPNLTAKLVKADGTELTDYLPNGESAYVKAESTTLPAPAYSASYYVKDEKGGLKETTLTAVETKGFPATGNGYYVVTAKNAEPKEWAATVVYMDKIDNAVPFVTLTKDDTTTQSGGNLALSWSAQKQDKTATATIASADINGKALNVDPGKTWVGGSFPVTHAGDYTLKAKDSAGNSSTPVTFLLENVPVRKPVSAGALFTVENALGGTGKVAVDINGVVGGKYVLADSTPASNTYAGSYEWKLLLNPPKPPKPPKQPELPEGIKLADVLKNDSDWLKDTTKTIDSLVPGEYTLYVRDATDKTNEATVLAAPVVVGDEAVTLTFEDKTAEGTRSLNWTAKKGANANNPITEVTINGKKVNVADGMSLSGTMVPEYGGSYALSATSGTVTAGKTLEVENVPLTTRSNDALLTIVKPWNTKQDNGKVTVNLTSTIAGKGGNPDTTLKNLTGGKYDPATSDEAAGTYVGKYEWRLEPGIAGDAEWLKKQLADAEGWTQEAEISNITAGNYVLILRDQQDQANAATALTIPISFSGEAVTFKTNPSFASSAVRADGSIQVEATGGYLNQNTFQFAARPIKDATTLGAIQNITDPLNAKDYPVKDGWKQPVWQLCDLAGKAPNRATLSGLRPGWYQVGVRAMLGVTSTEMNDLMTLYAKYTAAEERVKNADKAATPSAITSAIAVRTSNLATALNAWRNAPPAEAAAKETAYKALIASDSSVLAKLAAWRNDGYKDGPDKAAYDNAVKFYFTAKVKAETSAEKEAADLALTPAKSAYETKKGELEATGDAGYTAKPELWGNAATIAVYVPLISQAEKAQVKVSDLDYGTPGVVKVTLSEKKPTLSPEAEAQLIKDNKTKDILVSGPMMQVRIPAGTLSSGDDLDAMLMYTVMLPQNAGGYVVQYTDKNGVAHIVPFSLVTTKMVYYIASAPGVYSLINNSKTFSDIPKNFWGWDDIRFVTARALFQGVAENRFDCDGTMTRAMFVTVLGRLAGVNPADYKKQLFTDVPTDSWYSGFVAWANENGIVSGVGDKKFAPDAPVTREQICTILISYLNWVKINLPVTVPDGSFKDEAGISKWAAEAVEALRAAGIIKGTDLGEFRPGADASRAEVAAIYARLIQVILTA